jgi:hypothetical protein
MQALAAVVFERTPEGAAKVVSSSDTLPRALRSVLLAVDGRSSVARYEPFLTSLMPLDEKFAALEQLGLLRRKGGPAAGSVGLTQPALEPDGAEDGLSDTAPTEFMPDLELDSEPDSEPNSPPDFEPELQALSRQMGLIPDNPTPTTGQGPSPDSWDDMASFARLANRAAATVIAPKRVQRPAVAGTTTRLEDLLAEMEAFLSKAVGLDGLPVAIMVAQISSIEQLRLELPSYSELLRSYGLGAQTEAHITSLETQLALCS